MQQLPKATKGGVLGMVGGVSTSMRIIWTISPYSRLITRTWCFHGLFMHSFPAHLQILYHIFIAVLLQFYRISIALMPSYFLPILYFECFLSPRFLAAYPASDAAACSVVNLLHGCAKLTSHSVLVPVTNRQTDRQIVH